MNSKFLTLTLLSLMLICGNVSAQEVGKADDAKSSFDLELTEIVTTALVLGFSYSVLQGFKSKN